MRNFFFASAQKLKKPNLKSGTYFCNFIMIEGNELYDIVLVSRASLETHSYVSPGH